MLSILSQRGFKENNQLHNAGLVRNTGAAIGMCHPTFFKGVESPRKKKNKFCWIGGRCLKPATTRQADQNEKGDKIEFVFL